MSACCCRGRRCNTHWLRTPEMSDTVMVVAVIVMAMIMVLVKVIGL
jgi:hypothetical protein